MPQPLFPSRWGSRSCKTDEYCILACMVWLVCLGLVSFLWRSCPRHATPRLPPPRTKEECNTLLHYCLSTCFFAACDVIATSKLFNIHSPVACCTQRGTNSHMQFRHHVMVITPWARHFVQLSNKHGCVYKGQITRTNSARQYMSWVINLKMSSMLWKVKFIGLIILRLQCCWEQVQRWSCDWRRYTLGSFSTNEWLVSRSSRTFELRDSHTSSSEMFIFTRWRRDDAVFVEISLWFDTLKSLIMRHNKLDKRLNRCNVQVKVKFYQFFCICFYIAGLWCNYTNGAYSKLTVRYFLVLISTHSVTCMLLQLGLTSFNTLTHNYR